MLITFPSTTNVPIFHAPVPVMGLRPPGNLRSVGSFGPAEQLRLYWSEEVDTRVDDIQHNPQNDRHKLLLKVFQGIIAEVNFGRSQVFQCLMWPVVVVFFKEL